MNRTCTCDAYDYAGMPHARTCATVVGSQYPFSDALVFCSEHNAQSDIIEVDKCQKCSKPGKGYEQVLEKESEAEQARRDR